MSAVINKIVWATDCFEPADRALPYVAALARSCGASVELACAVLAVPDHIG
jgi:hypothetical protein